MHGRVSLVSIRRTICAPQMLLLCFCFVKANKLHSAVNNVFALFLAEPHDYVRVGLSVRRSVRWQNFGLDNN